MTAPGNFADDLIEAIDRKGSAAVVGLDPRIEWIPEPLRRRATEEHGATRRGAAEAIRRFCRGIIDLVAPHVVAVKPQIAFFEEYGPEGISVYSDVIGHARERGLLVIGDVKRSDIATTAEAYARAHLGGEATGGGFESESPIRADAVTVNPFLGSDGIRPFLGAVRDGGRGLFVLCRTSNPSAGEFQDLRVGAGEGKGGALHEVIARSITAWGEGLEGRSGVSPVGAVVGLSDDKALMARIRALLPRATILVPGFGAQGGGEEDLPALFHPDGSGAIVNSSRGVIFAYRKGGGSEEAWEEAVETAARDLRDSVNRAREAARRQ